MPDWQFRPFHINTSGNGAIGRNVSTTGAAMISPGSNVVVTPASMMHIVVGRYLNISGGVGTFEDVLVKAVDTVNGTFTADFVNFHSGNYTISSQRTVDVGTLEVNQPGTGVTITLYDGHPNSTPAGVAFAVINPNVSEPTRTYHSRCNRGLFYVAVATGAMGDYTVTYHDRSA